ncbi:MAG: biotin transporter BioY [Bacilli bacterium]|nr:biotin transporter BioY [Bacilli bacterium]
MTVRRITKDAILLALLCVTGMFSVPMGENIKVSLQLLTLFLIFGVTDSVYDKIIIPALYLLIGLVVPVYAGFQSGITPTFGFVISFVFCGIPFHFIYKYIKINESVRYVLACLAALVVVYIIGTIFMMAYLHFELGKTLLIAVVPYLGFDITKIAICTVIMKLLPDSVKKDNKNINSESKHDQ